MHDGSPAAVEAIAPSALDLPPPLIDDLPMWPARPLPHVPVPGESAAALWRFEPGLMLVLAAAALAYAFALAAARRRGRPSHGPWRAVAFFGGLAAVATALAGPLDAYNDESFLVHMLQHLVLMQLAAPLLVLGRPVHLIVQALPPRRLVGVLRATVGHRWLRRTLDVVCHPVTVAVLWNVSLGLWHVPRFYEAALADPLIHDLEHALFFAPSLLFWWIVIDPLPAHHRASPHAAFGMAFANCMGGGLVAAALLFSPRVLYPTYLAAEAAGRPWGLDPLADQRLGGVVMWLTGALFFGTMFRAIWPSRRTVPALVVGTGG